MGAAGATRTETEVGKAEMKSPITETQAAPEAPPVATDRPAKTLDAKEVNLFYGDFHAVEDVTMKVEPNKVTALIGSSGCGKTTFLRSLNRMHELNAGARVEGSIQLDGQDIYGPQVDPVQVRRLIGMVFQQPNPFPTMSVYDNVAAGLNLNAGRVKKSEKDDVVERSLRGAHLWNEVKDRLDKPGSGLSGGQQQRLCIARAIAVEPEVLLMDEPCSALDPVATLAIEDLIGELKSKYTIAIVTHNMQQASRASDITAFFNLEETGKPGRLIEIGATEKIFTSPEKQATEDYVSGRFG
ncbi:MAG TPA: phosphate ABC transporter ATP-binding protein PstB [Solirubrobacterales bacterium]|nr:phosphate ABC transporter ATP-binding protein PstB [Solirubrobacterales bacterium]